MKKCNKFFLGKVRRTNATEAPTASTNVPPTCTHCNTKFASHNNLRRHIIEVHKTRDNNSSNDDEEKAVDRTGECTKCNLSFSTVAEWVDHKINDAKNRKMTQQSGGYEWNCEICLKPFTRRERLMHHMLSHLNDREMDPDVLADYHAKKSSSSSKNGRAAHQDLSSDDDSDGEESEEMTEDEKPKTYSCDMCSVDFDSQSELRAHVVAEHFLNGSSNMTTIPTKSSGQSKSQSESDADDKLDIDEEVEQELGDVEFEEAEVDLDEDISENEEVENHEENSIESESSSLSAEPAKVVQQQPIGRIQVQLHRCRICNSAFIDQYKSVECMKSHQNHKSSFKCVDCQLFFKDAKQLKDHNNLCHS